MTELQLNLSTKKKLVRDLTNEELIGEFDYWNFKIETAKQWGAALTAAYEFRKDCEREMERRGIYLTNK